MREVQRFQAFDDEGTEVTIVKWEHGSIGRYSFKTTSGLIVKSVSDGVFIAPMGTRRILRRVHLDRPKPRRQN
jgi:hypothetical protein